MRVSDRRPGGYSLASRCTRGGGTATGRLQPNRWLKRLQPLGPKRLTRRDAALPSELT